MARVLTIGVLALQGGFSEHVDSLRRAAGQVKARLAVIEVRTAEQLASCDALIIPGGESTTLSFVAAQSGVLDALRDFVKVRRKPTWGTCAGLILLSREATSAKQGGQELIGGLDVRVHRNHFGRQRESFVRQLPLAFLDEPGQSPKSDPFPAVFIRAPVVDKLLPEAVDDRPAPAVGPPDHSSSPLNRGQSSSQDATVEILARLPGRQAENKAAATGDGEAFHSDPDGDIVALRQGNIFGTSFHPELTDDIRIHRWWLEQVVQVSNASG